MVKNGECTKKHLFHILLVCGLSSSWTALGYNHSQSIGSDTHVAFIETYQGVYEYINKPLDQGDAEKYCEHKFASLLSESEGSHKLPKKMLLSYQWQHPTWLKRKNPSEERIMPLRALLFKSKTDTKYARLLVEFQPLAEVTVCAYVQWKSTNGDFQTIFSYAVPDFFNEFQLRGITDKDGFIRFAIIVHGQHTPYSVMFEEDGRWHHFCVTWLKLNGTWTLYADGKQKATSTKLSASQDIIKGGRFIVGQDQDSFGGTFKKKESFSGNITGLNMWSKVLNNDEIEQVRSCRLLEKDLIFSWNKQQLEIEPTLQETEIPFVCPGNSKECRILHTNEERLDYAPCVTKLPFVCYYTHDVYQRLQNIKRQNEEPTFSKSVNVIVNRTLIPENFLTGEIHQFNVSEAAVCLQAIQRLMETKVSTVEPSDLLGIIQFLKNVAYLEIQSDPKALEDLSHHFVQVAGTIIEQYDVDLWSEVNPIIKGPMTLVHTVEKMASNLVQLLSDEKKEIAIHHRSIEVGIRQVDLNADSLVYTVQSNEKVDQIEVSNEEIKRIIEDGHKKVALVNTWFDFEAFQQLFGNYNTFDFIPKDSATSDGGHRYIDTSLGSAVISSTLLVGDQEVSTSVQYNLSHQNKLLNSSEKLERAVCAFWNFSLSLEKGGSWSSSGCSVKKKFPETITCFCNHTTNFAVLLQIYEVQRSSEEEWTLRTLTFIGCGVSLSALLVTLVLFLAVGVPKSERTTVHKNLIFALAAAEALLMFSELAKTNEVVCITVTACLHLFFMAAFAWMLVEGLLLWSKVVAVNMSEDRRMGFYYITGWGLPIIIVSVTLATSFKKYVADTHCWLNVQTDIIWAFVGPVLFILTVNTFVLFRVIMVTISSARRRSKMLTPNCSMEKQIGIQVWATAKPILVLLPVLGLTWLCGVLVHLNVVWAYVFIALNSFQGLYIFLVYAIYNSEVRNAIQRMKEKKKALSFTNCSHPTNYLSSPRSTLWDTGKASTASPSSNISEHLPVKNIAGKGNIVVKHPVNISSIMPSDKTAVELTAFKTSVF
ncbi:adhesion G-protein coupled receptor D2 [Spea bombifrons]|uniref:adhesion G-protein coupled receptor D2 n=1 Tax=Spea bombifrons TaxID=233779 RepID=UPI00234A164F|nr:adhesion G-protein coupled receptor D2 [Spea bombifrons]